MLNDLLKELHGWNGHLGGYAVYCGLAVGVLLLLSGLRQLTSRKSRSVVFRSRRMRLINQGRSGSERLAILKPPPRRTGWQRIPVAGALPKILRQADVPLSTGVFWTACGALGVLIFLAAAGFAGLLQAAAIAVLGGFGLPFALLIGRQRKQMDKLVHQLPDALEMLARGLKVGHPLNNSIGIAAREMPDPAGTELGIIYDQVTYGDDLPDAVQEFADRTGLEDAQYLAASISIQHGTGSDLSVMLETLARVIRNRIALRRKVHALASEGRLTAWLLSALPLVIFATVSVLTPSYYAGVADDPMFRPMMGAIVLLTVLNALTLRKLVNFRI
ncbi:MULTISPECIES: type II secretion system F family protein [unclassified Leisingera]|uniref:type II secretion system F family protein n=1 Tax=unclassified Leisingera TaxID=2614906 RepID=UPI0002D9214B|nr:MULTISPECIES: type II secretion system F family protein [unclassified Leisingera]